jgi:hypothetical protein
MDPCGALDATARGKNCTRLHHDRRRIGIFYAFPALDRPAGLKMS